MVFFFYSAMRVSEIEPDAELDSENMRAVAGTSGVFGPRHHVPPAFGQEIAVTGREVYVERSFSDADGPAGIETEVRSRVKDTRTLAVGEFPAQ